MKLLDEHSLRAIKNLVRTGPKDDKDAKFCEQAGLFQSYSQCHGEQGHVEDGHGMFFVVLHYGPTTVLILRLTTKH